jgi:hypothetical protein
VEIGGDIMSVNVYNMKLHEKVFEGGTEITRVPGGWIYTTESYGVEEAHWSVSSVFVPFNNEFQRDAI